MNRKLPLIILLFFLKSELIGKENLEIPPEFRVKPKIAYAPYQQALKRAQKEDKNILLIVQADWNAWSQKMEKSIFLDDRFQELADAHNYLILKIDLKKEGISESQKNLLEKYQIDSFPKSLILDSSGKALRQMSYFKGNAASYFKTLASNQIPQVLEIGETNLRKHRNTYYFYFGQQPPLKIAFKKPKIKKTEKKLNKE